MSFRDAKPNRVHYAIAELEQAKKLLMVVTQNIDGLHTAAGTSNDKLVELHGTNRYIECLACGARSDPEPFFLDYEKTREPPLCTCGGFLKPATVSFGQALPEKELDRAWQAAGQADLVVALGSTLSVNPAATIPMLAARRGTPYIIINRGPTDHDDDPAVSLRSDGDVGEIFPAAVDEALAFPNG